MPNQIESTSGDMTYDPDGLFDAIIKQLNLRNDAALSRLLNVAPPVISKIRHRKLTVGASLLIRMNEITGWSIKELRALMGDHRAKFQTYLLSDQPK